MNCIYCGYDLSKWDRGYITGGALGPACTACHNAAQAAAEAAAEEAQQPDDTTRDGDRGSGCWSYLW